MERVRVGSRGFKRAGSGREIPNVNFCYLSECCNTCNKKNERCFLTYSWCLPRLLRKQSKSAFARAMKQTYFDETVVNVNSFTLVMSKVMKSHLCQLSVQVLCKLSKGEQDEPS